MLATLLTFALLGGFWLLGLAIVCLCGADTRDLRVALAAPALGVTTFTVLGFAGSQLGLSASDCANPIALALTVFTVVVLAWRRPHVDSGVVVMAGICVVGFGLVGRPLLQFGFDWLANGNDDMANYVLSASRLVNHAIGDPLDTQALVNGIDYGEAFKPYQAGHSRPGSEMLVALVSVVTGKPTYGVFMPVIVSLQLVGLCSTGTLALQATKQRWTAWIAAALLAVSAMAAYGVLQQLIAQVFGLAIAAALLALLMRPELHRDGPRARDVVPIALLAAGMWLVYPELTALLGVSYVIWVGLLGARHQLRWRACLRLWVPSVAIAAVVLGPYTIGAVEFLHNQSSSGLKSTDPTQSVFGYVLRPGALAGVFGLDTLAPPPSGSLLNVWIVVGAVLIVGLAAIFAVEAWRATGAAVVGLVFMAFAVLLGVRLSAFGLFKLVMYVMPFAAAAIAVWVTRSPRRNGLVAIAPIGVVLVAGLVTQQRYVHFSVEPVIVPDASRETQIPAFRQVLHSAGDRLVVSAVENVYFQKIQAAAAHGHRLQFVSRDWQDDALGLSAGTSPKLDAAVQRLLRHGSWTRQVFRSAGMSDPFMQNTIATQAIDSGDCVLALPSTAEVPLNGLTFGTNRELSAMSCRDAKGFLVFVQSALGQHFYLPRNYSRVSFSVPEADPLGLGRISAFGRYALLQVVGASDRVRLALSMTNTYDHDGKSSLPPAVVVGQAKTSLPVVGRGSARVLSPPLQTVRIGAARYVLIDMNTVAKRPPILLSGISNLWGKSINPDSRYITTRVRDISVVDADAPQPAPPAMLQEFPEDLTAPGLEYSGLYEDGWVGDRAYAVLSNPEQGPLHIEGHIDAVAEALRPTNQTLTVLVDGHVRARQALPGPTFSLTIPVPGHAARHRVELRFSATTHLPQPDGRPIATQLTRLGFAR